MSLAKNCIYRLGNGATPTEIFTQITGVTELSWSGTTYSTESTTSHDNSTPVETLVPTIYSNGTFSLTLIYAATNTQHALLRTLSTSGASVNMQVKYTGTSAEEMGFAGYVTAFVFDTPVDGLLKANVTITVNGVMTAV
jgi:hypothetical protein